MTHFDHILTYKIVAILRGVPSNLALPIVEALYTGGVRTVEITLNTPNALAMIEAVQTHFGEKMLVGAGTVLSAHEAENAIKAGAKFTISPNLDAATIAKTKELGALSIPGAFTPTEIVNAYALGADIVKVFPATNGAAFIRDFRGPLPHIPLMPTGGVTLDNIGDFKRAGAVAFGIGSALVNAKMVENVDFLTVLTQKAHEFMRAVC
jgi:2-dehydro-3-deoxyphosphogluconate aldolase / (4S)-4-hydroxy-2-oxoglutarate aldolase